MIGTVLSARHLVRRVRSRAAEILVPVPTWYDQRSGRFTIHISTRRTTRRRATRFIHTRGSRSSTRTRTIQLDTGQEADVARVAVRDAREAGHNVLQPLCGIADGQIEQHAGTRSDPQQVFAGQQRGDAQTSGLVLPNYVVAGGQHLINRIAHVYLEQQLVADWKQ